MTANRKKKKPEVSVIIPTLNRDHLIGRSIQSVLNQTYQDIEIIVVDDGSTDNTEEVVKNYEDSRIIYLRHKRNRGGSAARNTGIKNSRGKYIAFIDSDDEWLPQKIQRQLRIFEKSGPELGIVYTGVIELDQKNEVIRKVIPKYRGSILKQLLLTGCVGTTSSPMVKRECFIKIGLFDETLPSYQDRDMWIRIAKKYEFDYVREPLVKYYIHPGGVFSNHRNRMIGRKIITKKIISEMTSNKKRFNFKKKEISKEIFNLGKTYAYLRNLKTARREYFKAIKMYPFDYRYYIWMLPAFVNTHLYGSLAKIKKFFFKKR